MNEPLTPPPGTPPPTEPPPPPETGAPGNPWENRHEIGWLDGLLQTVKLFVMAPVDAFARTRETGDYGSPLIFALILGTIGAVIGQLWGMLFGSAWLSMVPPEMSDQIGVWMAGSTASFLMTVLTAPIWVLVLLFIYAAVLHLCVLVVGAGAGSPSGFEGTFRVVSYASVAQLANVVPFIGGLVGMIWWVVLAVIGIMRLHRASQGQALAAVLIPLALCCVCVALAAISFGVGLAAMFSGQ